MEHLKRGWRGPGGQATSHQAVTQSRAEHVSLWEDSDCPLPAFPRDGKLTLAFQGNVSGKEGIS